MTDTMQTSEESGNKPQASSQTTQPRGKTHAQKMRELYALPAPLRTFPLPTFIPHNPLSLFHILYVWISQTVNTPFSHLDPLYQGWFSPETRSVHITDARAIRGLWEQGFYGKGTLSRSEPSWLAREKSRKIKKGKTTSEEYTGERRAERQKMKWERARKEREAIDQRLSEEALALADTGPVLEESLSKPKAHLQEPFEETAPANEPAIQLDFEPSLPQAEVGSHKTGYFDTSTVECFEEDFDSVFVERFYAPPVGPLELLALPNSIKTNPPAIIPFMVQNAEKRMESKMLANGHGNGAHGLRPEKGDTKRRVIEDLGTGGNSKLEQVELIGGSDTNEDTVDESVHSEETVETSPTPPNGSPSTPKMKRRKSVRFSPTVEKNTFIQTEPPSPERAAEGTTSTEEEPLIIRDQEHLQLTLEETFFLSYALGAIEVLDPETKSPISVKDLFTLCRQISYFPPRANPVLAPDDPFMINYVVYHHFRSLGWVIRSGIKFSVDYLLYNRGPVFTHAEFAVLILPSYSDAYWTSDPFLANYTKGQESRSWAWMSCINRVITQAKKTLILCYVDIPKPLDGATEHKAGIDGVLERYKIREFVMGRFVANRMRSSSGKSV